MILEITSIKIIIGFFIDLVIGDPQRIPHPVQFIGFLIKKFEKLLYKLSLKKIAGALLLVVIVTSTVLVIYFLSQLSIFIEIYFIYTIFATRSLGNEAMKVFRSLQNNDIVKAREQIGMLVSRDTGEMDEEKIIKATVETVSENIVDGITAPLFYLLCGGVAASYGYKAVNTLDSMVGYKNEKYISFGWASAKCDDLLNYIPARITAFFIMPLYAFFYKRNPLDVIKIVKRDRYNHQSPNSAHSEAAMAGILQCQLGGPSIYFGTLEDKPFIGEDKIKMTHDLIKESVYVMYGTAFLSVAIGLGCLALINIFV